jgi:hypothetical protein
MGSDDEEPIDTWSPPVLQVPLLVQMQKALAAEEPRESRELREPLGTVLERLGRKRKSK